MAEVLRRIAQSEKGQGLVEMALITPLMLILLAGIVEAGRAFTAYIQLTNAAREGVRQAAFTPQDTPTIDSTSRRELPSWVVANIVNVTVTCAGGSSTVYDNCVTAYPPTSGDKVRVSVAYRYEPIMPVVNDIVTIMEMTMSVQATMQVQ